MNYKFITILIIGVLTIFLCNNLVSAETILDVAENDSMIFDSEPELLGTYYVDDIKYYAVKHNNPLFGGISIYDEYGSRIKEKSLAIKIITIQQIKFDNETLMVLNEYKTLSTSLDTQIDPTVNSLNNLVSSLEATGTDINYDSIKSLSETLNSFKNSSHQASSSCSNIIPKLALLDKNKDYDTLVLLLAEYENCVSSIEPLKSNLNTLQRQIEPASKTLESTELLNLAFYAEGDLSDRVKDAKGRIDKLKNITNPEKLDNMDTNILQNSRDSIKSGIDKGISGYETRISPMSQFFKIAVILIALIIIVAALIVFKRKSEESGTEYDLKFLKGIFKGKKEEEKFGDFTIVVTESKTRDPVLGANVTLVNLKTKESYTGKTESKGTLALRSITTGDYEVEVNSRKHETEKTDVIIDVGVNRSMIVLRRKTAA